jgi:nucleotide-binding universal stress UspA family protein
MKMRTIVVGFDGSDMARLAIDAATRLADEQSVVHVVTASAPLGHEQQRRIHQLPEEFRLGFDPHAEAEGLLAKAISELTDEGISTESHLIVGEPASAILEVAEKVRADLVIVGSRGLSRVKRFTRGSVSARVAAHAPHSVLVVHQDD